MLHFQNTYAPAASAQTMNGRPLTQTDWSTEITPAPTQMTQQQMRPASDTGIGGIAEAPGGMQGVPGTMPGGMMSPGMQMYRDRGALDMTTGLPDEVIEAPTTVDEAYRGSLKAMLARNLGNYVVATFLVGTTGTVSWEGILFDVGNDFVTIYQEPRDRYIVIDIYSLKYIEFYDTRRREMCESLIQGRNWQGEP
ncbi:hypothetical protein [uncultured Dysosmobacter sp.]|uniref:hypothetical protein n=1 Tax=uncultured Dysosmobacter sp. TaxID=2591384 RepID=UPI002622940B|nr:hypothetical protein [uncultured Dysosmobacter sp.]